MPHPRISPKTTAEELRTSLEGALRFIWRYYGGSDPRAARTRVVEVVDLLQRHLDELGIDRSLTRSLSDIQSAFSEAERGHLVPLFQSKPLMARPPIELWKLHVRVTAALAMDLLMATKKSRREAAGRVASELKKLGIPIKDKGKVPPKVDVPPWKTVQGWREELAKSGRGAGWHPADWAWYGGIYLEDKERVLQRVREGQIDPEAEAKRLLKAIPKSLPLLG